MTDLFSEPQYDYLPVRWTVPGLPGDRSEYHSEISADWWDEMSPDERERVMDERSVDIAETVAQTAGVVVNPADITYKVYDGRESTGPVRPASSEEETA